MSYRELWNQTNIIDNHSSSSLELQKTMIDYIKKRVAVERDYIKSLAKLQKAFLPAADKKKKEQPKALSPAEKLWRNNLAAEEEIREMRERYCDAIEKDITAAIKDRIKDYEKQTKNWYAEYGRSRQEAAKHYDSFERAKKIAESCQAMAAMARGVYERASEDMNMTRGQVEKLKEDFNSKMMRACEANEDYETIFEESCIAEETFYASTLPSLLDKLEEIDRSHSSELGKIMSTWCTSTRTFHGACNNKFTECADSAVQFEAESQVQYLVSFKSDPMPAFPNLRDSNPACINASAAKDAKKGGSASLTTIPLTDDDVFNAPPNKLAKRANRRIAELNSACDDVKRQMVGLEKLNSTYTKTPKFSDMKNKLDVDKQLESCEVQLKELGRRICRIEQFVGAGINTEADEQSLSSPIEPQSHTVESPIEPPVLQLDQVDNSDITCFSPASDSFPDVGTAISKARVLFDFKATEDTHELSISRGEVLDILEKGDDGWWLARRDNDTGFVPNNYVCEIEE